MAFAGLLAMFLAAAPGLSQVSAVEVSTPQEITVMRGAEATLQCTFTSTEVISSATSVSWSFQAEGSPFALSFFYYSNGRTYPGKDVQFKDRVSWAGNLNKKDASISITNFQFRDNGTYVCDVKNPPDIIVTSGEIRLRVVERVEEVPSPEEEISVPTQLDSTEERIFAVLQEINTKFKSLNNRLDGFESKLDEVRHTFTSCSQKTTAVEE